MMFAVFVRLVIVLLSLVSPVAAIGQGVTIGAIRWDASAIDHEAAERPYLERSLSPQQYQGRAPTCALTLEGAVTLQGCSTKEQIDKEILRAKSIGIDYWVYCWYDDDDPMQHAWRLHEASRYFRLMRWAVSISNDLFIRHLEKSESYFNHLFATGNYMTVLNGRPLVFIQDNCMGSSALKKAIFVVRRQALAGGLGNPYIVVLNSSVDKLRIESVAVNADAVSAYAYAPAAQDAPYSQLVASVEEFWAALAGSGLQVVPLAMTGWDRRPRVTNSVSWERSRKNRPDEISLFYRQGKSAEVMEHIESMKIWIKLHAASSEAATGVVYSWNEYDEGGTTLSEQRNFDVLKK